MPVISTIAAATARAFGAFKSLGGAVDEFFDYVTLLLHGDGTNGAQNNTFLDSSANNFTITRNGNTTQGTFSPFSQTGWSNYFDGSGDYLSVASNAAFGYGTGDFTIECWFYLNTLPGGPAGAYLIDQRTTSPQVTPAAYVYSDGSIQYFVNGSTVITGGSVVINQWNHWALSRASGTTKMFLNGTQIGSSYSDSNSYITAPVAIGARFNGQDFVTGYISNFRIVKGTAVYTSAFTPSTTPLTAIANTSLLTCQSNRFRDASSNNFAITVNGNTSVQAFSPFAPTAAYSAATVGGSGYFDGSGDYLAITTGLTNQFDPGSAYTFEGWFYINDTTDEAPFYVGGSTINWSASTGVLYQLYIASGTIYWQFNGGGSPVSISGTAPATNQWCHVAVGYNGTTTRLWVNGVSIGTSTASYGLPTYTAVSIGAQRNGGSAYTGYSSNIRFVKGTDVYGASNTSITVPTSLVTAISGTSLLLNFTNAGIIDNTAKNVLETVGNAQISTSVKKFGTGSLAFDGSGDYLKGVGNNPNLNFGSGNFTIEFWMYTADVTPSVAAWFVAMFNSNSGQNSWGVRLETSGALVMYLSSDGGESPTTISAASPALSDSTWHHIAVVRNGSGSNNITIYVDGVSKATGTFSSALFNSNQPVTIGIQGNTSFNQYFNGYIDDLRITKGIARYTSAFTPPAAAFADQ